MVYVPGNKFGLLLWKNWLLQKRKVALTIFEVLIPIVVAVMLLLIRQTTEQTSITEPVTWDGFSMDYPSDVSSSSTLPEVNWTVAYTPNNTVIWRLMKRLNTDMEVDIHAFSDEESMKEFLMLETIEAKTTLGGIVFQSDFPTDNSLPDAVAYKIRMKSVPFVGLGSKDWRTDRQYPVFTQNGPRNEDVTGGNPGYYNEGFLVLQRALDAAIILERNSTAVLDDIVVILKRFPYPTYIKDDFLGAAGSFMPFVIMLSFLILAPSIVKDIVLEKERKLKESMKLMGMPNWMHWLAWFIKYLVFLTVSVVIMTFCYVVDFGKGAIFNLSDGTVIFVFLMLYAVSLIVFCFAISVFFSGSNAGAAAGGILYFLTYVPYFFIDPGYDTMTLTQKLLSCLLPNCAMALGFKLVVDSEFAGTGAQWIDIAKPINADDTLTIGHVMLFLVIDTVLAFLITWYVDAVFPGEYGVPKPWYFFVTKWYWCGGSQGDEHQYDVEDSAGANQGEFFEESSADTAKGIQVQGLRKEFKSFGKPKRVAVDAMHLDMYEGQITALLGHNGAGKTTTMFMLTGFIPPTKGTARVNGFDIRTDITNVRKNLGLCPQHDVLYDTLTVTEHLQFFARLKGCDTKQMETEIAEILKLFKLEPKKDAFAKSLSGGMKRKLSVGIALIGGSKIVILDEPTSGMDPEARRQTWDILQTQRQGRTIILTTHFMDEADYLGDRIAIMASGKLVCCGSSLFLKKKYGVGYHMVMVKEPSCNVSKVEETITKYVPDAKLESNISAELSFVLPHESSAKFEDLFTVLENTKKALGIASFGASVTTMEEVFLKVGEGEDKDLESILQNKNYGDGAENKAFVVHGDDIPAKEDKQEFIELNDQSNAAEGKKNGSKVAPAFGVKFRRNTGFILHIQQFWAMFLKKVIYSWRSPIVSIVQLLIPVIFTIFACLTVYTSNANNQDPVALPINFSYFESPVMYYRKDYNGPASTLVADLVSAFDSALRSSGSVEEVQDESLLDAFIEVADDNLRQYKNSYLVAGHFEGNFNGTSDLGFTGYFQNEAIHSPALALNAIGNTLLQYFTGETKYSLEVINHPVPKPASVQSTEDIQTSSAVAFAIAINITFGMSFLVATFVLFVIRERYIKAKHCQFVSGVSTLNFWLSSFAWDMINFMIPALIILLLFLAFNVDGYTEDNNLGYVFLLFLLYGASTLPLVYLCSFLFDVAATGYIFISILSLLTGLGGVIVVFILKLLEDTKTIGENLEWVFYIFLPNFCFAYSLQEMYNNYANRVVCEILESSIRDINKEATLDQYCVLLSSSNGTSACCPDNCGDTCANFYDNVAHWESPGIGRGILFMCLQFILYSALLFFVESGVAKRLKNKIFASASNIQARTNEDALLLMGSQGAVSSRALVMEDNDVVADGDRIKNTNLSELIKTDTVVLKEVKKYYGSFLAVDSLSLGVSQGECFGLLGVNGAGKTTTFKMLTGDESISNGKAFLCGHNVSTNIKKVQQNVGYCPQFDALIDKLTVSETLSMYARLRGVQQADVGSVVTNLVTNLLLTEYKDKQAGQLSGGNKRKLSTAIALIGDPPVVFLDEPTTGMDPVARRLLWNTLTQVRESGRTLVLTSHSMEECEALCTRMAIMVNGQFKCLGGAQHLKHKFGEGYTLMAKVTLGDTSVETEQRTRILMDFITKEFPGCTLKDLHRGLVMYQISSTNLSWARVFGTMERAKVQYQIEDYSVSQTTLEQVFINFARAQIPPLEEKISMSAKCSSCCRFFCCCCC